MSRSPLITRTVPALRRADDLVRKRKATVALTATMGALHDEHVSLDARPMNPEGFTNGGEADIVRPP
ncbi:pantoate--beta-alanine ligase [Bradyrhizobium manausense]|nr:pantoate--beta-alanine ligase [Bradyrhizobium manausense]